jgi:hypothetical protein
MRSSPQHRVLAGLPGEGALPLQFSVSGMGMHREGYVVALLPDSEPAWVGNFQPGATTFNDVIVDSAQGEALVIAGGQGYVVNLSTGKLIDRIGGFIQDSIELPDRQRYVFSTATDFDLYRNGKIIWRTRRLSWDGFRNVVVQGQILIGEAWMFDDTWHPFVVDLSSGTASGGSYNAAA